MYLLEFVEAVQAVRLLRLQRTLCLRRSFVDRLQRVLELRRFQLRNGLAPGGEIISRRDL
jgi:hypothetical protein